MSDSTRDSTRQVPLRLPNNLVDQIDTRREPLGISRNEWITNMITWCLANTQTITDRDERMAHNQTVKGGPLAVDPE
jgi:hypothetical protein